MPVTPVTVYAVTCDACSAVLDDEEGGTFIVDLTGLAATLRPLGWTALGDEVLCHLRDDAHQAFIDRAMPPEPVMQAPGQLALDGSEEPTDA